MDTFTTEQDVCQEAIRRHLLGERPADICRDLGRSPSWFDKWWAEYRRHPHTDFADHSRAPHTHPDQTPASVEHAIVTARGVLESAATPATQYGLIGAPSASTTQRIMARHGQTHPIGAGADSAYYPWPVRGLGGQCHSRHRHHRPRPSRRRGD